MAKGPKYGDFNFPSDFGFNGSSGKTMVKGYARGGSKKQAKVEKVMHEFGQGELHSGSKTGPVVKNPKQAIAIALSEAKGGKKMAMANGGQVPPGRGMRRGRPMPEQAEGEAGATMMKPRQMPTQGALARVSGPAGMAKSRQAGVQRPKTISQETTTERTTVSPVKLKKGGCAGKYAEGGKADIAQDKAMVKSAVHKHERAMHPGEKPTPLKKGGCAGRSKGVPAYSKAPKIK
jgi:hypothetical protein